MNSEVPLFPLNTVLFPGSRLPLRVFELRYRRLVDICGHDQPFAIARIRDGGEVGEPAFSYDIGTTASIRELRARVDGSLGVLVEGQARVRVDSLRVEDDGLIFASVRPLFIDELLPIPADMQALAAQLQRQGMSVTDAGSLAWRLADTLPLTDDFRQDLLEEDDISRRLQHLREWLNHNQAFFTA